MLDALLAAGDLELAVPDAWALTPIAAVLAQSRISAVTSTRISKRHCAAQPKKRWFADAFHQRERPPSVSPRG